MPAFTRRSQSSPDTVAAPATISQRTGQPRVADPGKDGDKPNANDKAKGPRRQGRKEHADHVDVMIDDVLVHRVPSPVARSLRYLLAATDLPPRVAVTAALHGEGVTSVSRSLAALIAYDWRRSVCWVDINWWKHSSPEQAIFDYTLVDAIEGKVAVADIAKATSVPGLSFVSGGEIPISYRARVTNSDTLGSLLDDLGEQFEFLVLDLPPAQASSDALALCGHSDGYVLVVRQRSTSDVQIRATLNSLNTAPCLGSVLNVARSKVPRWLRTSNEVWALNG